MVQVLIDGIVVFIFNPAFAYVCLEGKYLHIIEGEEFVALIDAVEVKDF